MIKIRQPLQVLYTNIDLPPEFKQILMDELNVKEVIYIKDLKILEGDYTIQELKERTK